MNDDKMYQIKLQNGITVYIRNLCDNDIERAGLVLPNEPKIFYWTGNGRRPQIDDLETIDLEDYVIAKLHEAAEEEKEKYITEHLRDYSIYSKEYLWWQRPILKDQPKKYQYLSFRELERGMVILGKTEYEQYEYNLIKQCGECQLSGEIYTNEEKQYAFMDMVYSSKDIAIEIAQRQMALGLAPRAYAEMQRIMEYIDGKKSLNILLKNNQVIKLKGYYGSLVLIRDLIDVSIMENGVPYCQLQNSYRMAPMPSQRLNLNEVERLEYGRTKFVINVEALIGPDAMQPFIFGRKQRETERPECITHV